MTSYCTPADVANFMFADKFDFDANTPLTETDVQDFCDAATAEIEAITKRYWQAKTSTQELRDITPNIMWGTWNNNYFSSFKTRYSPIQTISTLEVYVGTSWKDITANEGFTKDWHADYDRGIIFLHTSAAAYILREGARITYTYGESSVPANVKQACILLTSYYVIQSEDYNLLFPSGSEHLTVRDKAVNWRQRAMELLWSIRKTVYWA